MLLLEAHKLTLPETSRFPQLNAHALPLCGSVWVPAIECSCITALRKRVDSRYRMLMHYPLRKRVGFHYPSRMHAQVPSDIRISSSYWTQRTLYAAFSNILGAIGLHCSYWLEKRPILVIFQWIASLESENMLQELKICK